MRSDGRLVVLGYGTIARAALPMLVQTMDLPRERMLVMDGDDNGEASRVCVEDGIEYRVRRLCPDNLAATMAQTVCAGDLLLNLSVGVDSIELADWCQRHGVAYVDTAIEPWESDEWYASVPVEQRTEYAYHQRARARAARWTEGGPTTVFTHGANPGLVNHFAKAALLDVAEALGRPCPLPATREAWAALARELDVRVIHVSERDTQRAAQPKRPDEFVNTWSIPGFVEEATMPAEVGWGTHEKTLPEGARQQAEGPCNAIYFEQPSARMLLRSWVPRGGQIAGFALPHSECITMSDYFTVWDGDRPAYRPTVAFAYLPCDLAVASLHEVMMRDFELQPDARVLADEITGGRDELGVLLMGHELGSWWYGSQLDIHEARRLVPGSNPTAVQVAAGAVAATVWAARNPGRGFNEPEHLPHDEILAIARPWLGPMVSVATDWTPLSQRSELFDEPWLDRDDPWQFTNFVVR